MQETWLRLDRADPGGTEDLRGWLTVVIGRICLDMLRARKARREAYAGSWLPEPLLGEDATRPWGARPGRAGWGGRSRDAGRDGRLRGPRPSRGAGDPQPARATRLRPPRRLRPRVRGDRPDRGTHTDRDAPARQPGPAAGPGGATAGSRPGRPAACRGRLPGRRPRRGLRGAHRPARAGRGLPVRRWRQRPACATAGRGRRGRGALHHHGRPGLRPAGRTGRRQRRRGRGRGAGRPGAVRHRRSRWPTAASPPSTSTGTRPSWPACTWRSRHDAARRRAGRVPGGARPGRLPAGQLPPAGARAATWSCSTPPVRRPIGPTWSAGPPSTPRRRPATRPTGSWPAWASWAWGGSWRPVTARCCRGCGGPPTTNDGASARRWRSGSRPGATSTRRACSTRWSAGPPARRSRGGRRWRPSASRGCCAGACSSSGCWPSSRA